jgi:thioredoxin 1
VTIAMEDRELKKIKEEKIRKMLDQAKAGVVKLTSSSFDSFLNTGLPVLVDFWADWCMPCRMMAPVMDELSKVYAGKVLFGKVNVDENQQIAGRYGIMSIPHFLVFKNGSLVEKIVGAVGRDPLENAIKKYI